MSAYYTESLAKAYPSPVNLSDPGLKAAPSELEPFDLERAKAGEPIVYGAYEDKVEFIAIHKGRVICIWNNRGYHGFPVSDVRMAPKPKRKFWVNVYKSSGYDSKEQADEHASSNRFACIEVSEGDGL